MTLLLALFACHRAGDTPTVPTNSGSYTLEWTTAPAPLPLDQLFEVDTVLRDAKTGAPVEDGTVTVDARMPQHGHGMTTKPEAAPGPHPGGHYVMKGMKFHMPGEWTLTFDVTGPAGPDHADVKVTL